MTVYSTPISTQSTRSSALNGRDLGVACTKTHATFGHRYLHLTSQYSCDSLILLPKTRRACGEDSGHQKGLFGNQNDHQLICRLNVMCINKLSTPNHGSKSAYTQETPPDLNHRRRILFQPFVTFTWKSLHLETVYMYLSLTHSLTHSLSLSLPLPPSLPLSLFPL